MLSVFYCSIIKTSKYQEPEGYNCEQLKKCQPIRNSMNIIISIDNNDIKYLIQCFINVFRVRRIQIYLFNNNIHTIFQHCFEYFQSHCFGQFQIEDTFHCIYILHIKQLTPIIFPGIDNRYYISLIREIIEYSYLIVFWSPSGITAFVSS